MSAFDDPELVDQFEEFFRAYYHDAIGTLARQYPSDKRSLYISWDDLYQFDPALADDYLDEPARLQAAAEQALQVYDLPVDVDFENAYVRVHQLPETTPIRELRAEDVNTLIAVSGIVRKATDVRPKVKEAAFRCQRCETITYVPQTDGGLQEPHECRGCDRQGPFRIAEEHSRFVDAQRLRIQESPEGLRGGETPQAIDVHIQDDITGEVTPGDRVTVTGILQLDQDSAGDSTIFDIYMDGVAVDLDEEEFQDMEITDADQQAIVELSERDDLYESIIDSIAPSIHGYRQQKLAIALQLFSGVTKHLPDGSRIRGDLHLLLIGDPGTGKCVSGDTLVTLADGTEVPIADLVENNLNDPTPIDDGVYDTADLEVLSMDDTGAIEPRRATKVWKRTAPEKLYRLETTGGHTLEVTPSHPLFVQSDLQFEAVQSKQLDPGDWVAVPQQPAEDSRQQDLIPVAPTTLRSIRRALSLDHDECNLPKQTYQAYERGTTPPSRSSLRAIVTAFEDRLAKLQTLAEHIESDRDGALEAACEVLGLSQPTPVEAAETTPGPRLSHSTPVADGGVENAPPQAVHDRITDAMAVEEAVSGLRTLLDADVGWEKLTTIEAVDPESDWVYDLEVAETHSYLSNDVVSHNSQMLQYIRNIAPRSVYTSGKGSSSAGLTAAAVRDDFGDGQQWTLEAGALVLADQGIAAIDELDKMRCVTGDTRVHTPDGPIPIEEFASKESARTTVESHATGRTIRGLDATVYTMTADGQIESRSVTAVHEYDAPEKLIEVRTQDGQTVVATPEHPFYVSEGGDRRERAAAKLSPGDRVLAPEPMADGGAVGLRADTVTTTTIEAVNTREDTAATVYDLTVEDTHNFIANGLVIHNSEDRSAMHEALEQQSYHPATEVLLADGRRLEIGELVDSRMDERAADVVDGIDCELLPVDNLGVHTVDPSTGNVTKTTVDRISRHAAPDEFIRMTFSNGRQITVTPDHPTFVGTEDGIDTIPAHSVCVGDPVPAPRRLPNAPGGVSLTDRPTPATYPDAVSPPLAEFLGLITATGHLSEGPEPVLSLSSTDPRVLERGTQLARSVFDVEAPETIDSAGGTTNRWHTPKLHRWLSAATPELVGTPETTRLPVAVLGSSVERIRRFLVGAFAGAGDSESLSFLVPSVELAEDYADALSKLGIASQIDQDTTDSGYRVTVREDSAEQFITHVVTPATEEYDDRHSQSSRSDGDTFPPTGELTQDPSGLRFYRVSDIEVIPNEGEDACEWVYDVTVQPTNTFVSKGLMLHNSISVSKAGINATLRSRCSLLGAANPAYGRFDQYEPIGEQIDLEPALISRFDLIFTVTDQPDPEEDRALADHILTTNYAGEVRVQQEQMTAPDIEDEKLDAAYEAAEPEIDPELLRKYVAYAQQNCHPRMSEPARDAIEEFYVDLRSRGADEDAPVPVTARKLEALIRLAEASARIRLADTVTKADADRVINIVRASLQDIGVDPETGQFDADVVETGTSKSQRDRIKDLKGLIESLEPEYDGGVPVEEILEQADDIGLDANKAEEELERLKQKGEVYEPRHNRVRTT